MNLPIEKALSKTQVGFWLPRLFAFGLLAFGFAGWLIADDQHASPDLTVHEWGTFTAIAGRDGRAAEWLPLGLPRYPPSTDLPQFVEHINGVNFKLGLRGTIRMETPVVYFYSPHDVTVSAKVSFSRGLITEWYPHADRAEPTGVLTNASLGQLRADGSITWNHVAVSPIWPVISPPTCSRIATMLLAEGSSPVRVQTSAGEQQEKFLFYRGVSASPLPISAKLTSNGKLAVKSLSGDEIPNAILFERRGERVGYRLTGPLTDEIVVSLPMLNGSLDSATAIWKKFVGEGLYRDEARAMLETWKDSWFEEGSRLIYIVPRGLRHR